MPAKTHGLTNTRLYRIWCNMKTRCYCKTDFHYPRYGARGIVVCTEWKNDFQAFYDWSMSNGYSDDLTIDRIDVNGNYEPQNCRWADNFTQANNTRRNRYYTYNNETHTLTEWSRIVGIKREILKDRIFKLGWSFEDAIKTPKMDRWDHRKGAKNVSRRNV